MNNLGYRRQTKIENQPRFKIFDLIFISTCNIDASMLGLLPLMMMITMMMMKMVAMITDE